MPIIAVLALLSAAPAPGVEVSIARSVTLVKGTVWPTSPKTGAPKSTHSIDGPSGVTVKLPSGKSWRAEGLHSVTFSLTEPGDSVRSVHLRYERAPGNWADTVQRALQLAHELGAPAAQQDLARKRLLENPGKGSNRYFPSFSVEGCISVTTTITPEGAYDPKRPVNSWTVSVELVVSTPEFWRNNHAEWPATCPP